MASCKAEYFFRIINDKDSLLLGKFQKGILKKIRDIFNETLDNDITYFLNQK